MAKRENSVYSGIAKEIEEKIKSGEYKQGSLLPPERALKEMYGVERTTVRRALDILSEKGVITKKAGLGNVVGSDTSAKEEKNTGTHTGTVNKGGLVICIGSFSADTCAFLPVIEAFETYGYTFTRVSAADTATLEKLVNSNDCFGAVITENTDKKIRDILDAKFIPYIYAFAVENGNRCVVPDTDGAMSSLVDELYSNGHRKYAFIGTEKAYSSYIKAASIKSIDTDNDYCMITSGGKTSAYSAFLSLYRRLSGRFTCVVTSDIQTALGVMEAAVEKGVKVPQQLSVVSISYDENSDISCAVFDKDVMAREMLNCLETQSMYTTGITCTTSVGFEFAGNTVSSASGSRKNTMSDFLL